MPSLSFTTGHTVTPLLLGAILVASVLPIREVVAVAWMVILFVCVRDYIREGQRRLAVLALFLQLAVMSGVVTAATLAPNKITDRILDKAVTLPEREMTLADLDRYIEEHQYRHDAFPIMVWLTFVESDGARTVEFPGTEITLRQFVNAIENQTPLRRRFSGCGNGYTVLWGNDCSFGLCLRDPKAIRW
jgi:hypothetical protein